MPKALRKKAGPATISIDDMEGKLELPIPLGSFGQVDTDEYEVDDDTRKENQRRLDSIQADIRAAVAAVGPLVQPGVAVPQAEQH